MMYVVGSMPWEYNDSGYDLGSEDSMVPAVVCASKEKAREIVEQRELTDWDNHLARGDGEWLRTAEQHGEGTLGDRLQVFLRNLPEPEQVALRLLKPLTAESPGDHPTWTGNEAYYTKLEAWDRKNEKYRDEAVAFILAMPDDTRKEFYQHHMPRLNIMTTVSEA